MSSDNDVTPPERPRRSRIESGRLRQLRDSAGFHNFLQKGLWPLLTILSTVLYGRLQHYETVQETVQKAASAEKKAAGAEKKVDEVSKEASETTKRAYRGLAEPANKTADALTAALARIAELELATKGQAAVISDFVVEGRPATKIDKGLLKVVKANAVRSSRELAARAAKPIPKLKPVPLELPPAPPRAERPTPAPVKIDHPTPPPAPPAQPQILDAGLAKQ